MNIIKKVCNYTITNSTFVLKSTQINNRIQTTIYDKHGQSIIDQRPLKLVRNNCRLHGTSYEAALAHAKEFFGENRHKLPIVISMEYGNPCVIFPIFSPYSETNCWVVLHPIINIQQHDDETIVTFSNMTEVTLPIQYKTFNQLYVRAMMYYKYVLRKRNSSSDF